MAHPHSHHPLSPSGHAAGHDHYAHDQQEDPGHTHTHSTHTSERRLFWALLLTGSFMVAELVGGLLSGSLALLADAAHMLTDAAALAMAFLAVRAAGRPATPAMSYGHHRWQVLAAFVNGTGLLFLALWILIEAAQRLLRPGVIDGGTVILIASLGLAVNVAAFAALSGGEKNLNVRAALAHVLGDLLGSIAALLAGALIWWRGWMIADPVLSAFVALLMLRNGWSVARQSAHVLLEGAPAGLDERSIVEAVERGVAAVSSVHHVHAWSLSDEKPVVTLHATLRSEAGRDDALFEIQRLLETRFGIQHSTIQIEDSSCCASGSSCAP